MASYKNALGDLSTAIAQLNQAYKAANTIDEKDEIFSMLELLQDEVNEIAGAGLASSDTAYMAQTQPFKSASQALIDFRKKIDGHVKYIKLAGQVAEALAKVITLLA